MEKIKANELTLEEKANLLKGSGNWHTALSVKFPMIAMSDGPHGLRIQHENDGGAFGVSVKNVCFPTASLVACSFDKALVEEMGRTIAAAAKNHKISLVLGPGVNIKRSPMCGRNFEYFSEDPFLSGTLGAGFIKGVENAGVMTSLKHFACNNQETRRMTIDAIVDKKALYELYLESFRLALLEKPSTVMCCYNVLNGEYGSESEFLLKKVLREEFSFDGIVISDWGAVNDRAKGVMAGLDLEMPSSFNERSDMVISAVEKGLISEEQLNEMCQRILDFIHKGNENLENTELDIEKQHELAVKIAENSMVLLENRDEILPIPEKSKILVVGELAKKFRFQGQGSSFVSPFKVENILDSLSSERNVEFAKGYDLNSKKVNPSLISEACEKAKGKDVVVAVVGLTDLHESEGFDRENLNLPKAHDLLIEQLSQVGDNVVVVLVGGAPVLLPWRKKVKGILNAYLSGEGGGKAVANILLGKVNPSGRLAETYALSCKDHPSSSNFPGRRTVVPYKESIFVGYRFFDVSKVDVAYPFGYGLSYTNFECENIEVESKNYKVGEKIKVKFTAKNTGGMDGKCVLQFYVGKKDSKTLRPVKELKGYTKMNICKGEVEDGEITLNTLDFRVFDPSDEKVKVENGNYEIYVATSSRDILKVLEVTISGGETCGSYPFVSHQINEQNFEKIYNVTDEDFEKLTKCKLVERDISKLSLVSTFEDLSDYSFWGKRLKKIVISVMTKKEKNPVIKKAVEKSALEMPLRSISPMTKGMFSIAQSEGFIEIAQGHLIKGVKTLTNKNLAVKRDKECDGEL